MNVINILCHVDPAKKQYGLVHACTMCHEQYPADQQRAKFAKIRLPFAQLVTVLFAMCYPMQLYIANTCVLACLPIQSELTL